MAVKALMTDETGKQIVDAIREKAGLEERVSDLEKNKVDKSSIAQTTGTAEDKVISQRAVTEELEKKFDKSNVVQSTGDAEDKVMSQAAATKEFGKLSEEIGGLTDKIFEPDTIAINTHLTAYNEYGYFSASNGGWNASEQYRTKYKQFETDTDIYLSIITLNQPYVFMCIYNGDISKENFVAGYRYDQNTLPTHDNQLHLPKGYSVAISYYLTNEVVCHYTESIENNTLAKTVKLNEEQISQFMTARTVNVESINGTYGMEKYNEYGYFSASNGGWNASEQYRSFYQTFESDTEVYLTIDIQNQPYVFMCVYNGAIIKENFVAGYKLSDGSLPTANNPLTVLAGQTITVSTYFTNTVTVHYDKTIKGSKNIDSTALIVWFGDSISQYSNLPDRIVDKTGLSICNCTFAGSPMTYGDPNRQNAMGLLGLSASIASGDFSAQEANLAYQRNNTLDENMWEVVERENHLDTLKNLDFGSVTDIVVMLGTNDLNNSYVETLDKFKNGMRSAIVNILTAYPHIRLRFITNPYRADITPANPDIYGHSLADIVKAEKEVCGKFNIPLLDFFSNCGINELNKSVYMSSDNLHLSQKGYDYVAKILAKWIVSN